MPRQDDPAYEQPEELEEEEDVSSEEYSDDSEEKTAEFSYKKNDLIMPGGEYEDTVFLIEKASKAPGKRVEIQLAPLAVQLHVKWEDEEDHPWKDLSFFIHRNEAAAGRRAYVAERKRLDELAGTARAPPAARALSAAAQQRQQAAAAASAVSEVQQVYFLLSTASSPSGLDKDQKVGEIFANYSAPRRIFEAMGDPADRTFGSQACSSASRWCRAVNTTFEEALRCGNATLRVRPGSLGVLIAASGTAKPKFTAVGSLEVFKAIHKLGPLVVTLSVISSDPSDAESSTPQQQAREPQARGQPRRSCQTRYFFPTGVAERPVPRRPTCRPAHERAALGGTRGRRRGCAGAGATPRRSDAPRGSFDDEARPRVQQVLHNGHPHAALHRRLGAGEPLLENAARRFPAGLLRPRRWPAAGRRAAGQNHYVPVHAPLHDARP